MYDHNDYSNPMENENYSGAHAGRECYVIQGKSNIKELKSYIELYDRLTITPEHVKNAYESGYLDYIHKLKYKEVPIYYKKEKFILSKKGREELFSINMVPLTRKEKYLQMIYKDL